MTSRNLGLYATAVLIEYSSLVITVGGSRFSHGPIVLFGFTGMANGIYTLFRITGRSEVFEQSAEKNLITAVRKYIKRIEVGDMPSLSLSAAGTATKIHIQYAIQALRVRHLETRHILLRGRYVTRLFQIHKPPQSAW